jgi:F-type H+-transporting ATPase subunit b
MRNGTRFVSKKLAASALLGLLLACTLCAQTSKPMDQSATSSAENASSKSDGAEKASGEDETAQFKHSASVKLLSRITGLSIDGAYWLAVGLNFAIVIGVIAWASKKNLPAMFRNRTATIQKSLEEARRASEEANRRLSDIESRLGRLDREIADMRAAGEKEAAAEEERIKAATAEDAQRILESAQQEIAAAAKAARRDLTVFAADLAVSLAAKQIHVDGNTDRVLVRRFAHQLSDDGAPGKKA